MRIGIALIVLCACDSSGGTSNGDAPIGDGKRIDSNACPCDAPNNTSEPPELAGMTADHNQVRAAVDTTGIAGGALPQMQWDPALATLATNWVAQCQSAGGQLLDHSSTAYRTNAAGYAYVGENIYASSGTATASGAVNLWASEKASFTYPTTCAGTCGHYTQIVWRSSLHVGCAVHNCPALGYPNTIVCNYGPGGNYGSQPPY